MSSRLVDARQLLGQLIGYANDVNLLSEEYDPSDPTARRQFPVGVQPPRA
jgi:hypothetical protein